MVSIFIDTMRGLVLKTKNNHLDKNPCCKGGVVDKIHAVNEALQYDSLISNIIIDHCLTITSLQKYWTGF